MEDFERDLENLEDLKDDDDDDDGGDGDTLHTRRKTKLNLVSLHKRELYSCCIHHWPKY